MRQRTRTNADIRIHDAVGLALKDPRPNPWAAAFAGLWTGASVPTAVEIQATWDLLAEKLTDARRVQLEERIRSEKSASKKKRLRAELRQGIIPPQVSPTQGHTFEAADGHRQLGESYSVDTDPEFFRRRHEAYRKAQRDQVPVLYFVRRGGEPLMIEFHAPPAPSSRRPPAGRAPRKLTLAGLRADLKKHRGSSQVDRARRLGVSVRTIRDYQRQLDKAHPSS